MQKHLTLLLAVTLVAAIGCSSQPTTGPAPQPKAGQRDASPKDQSSSKDETTNKMALGAGAEPITVQIKPGQERKIELTGVAADDAVTIKVDPENSKVRPSLDGQTLRIRAEEGASGEVTLTIQSGEESGKVTVKVK